jgi:hypothetical protein
MALVCVAFAQILNPFDPLIFGKVIDDFALHPGRTCSRHAALDGDRRGVRAGGPDCLIRMIIQKAALDMFNDACDGPCA